MWSGGWQQWPLQQAMYQNMPHDQVDWAALAKQWIDMQHVPSADGSSQPLPPPVPPHVIVPDTEVIAPAPVIDPYRPADDAVSIIVPKVPVSSAPTPMDVVQTEVPFKPTDSTSPVNYWSNNWEGSTVAPIPGWNGPSTDKDLYQFGDSMHGNLPSYDYNHGSDPYSHPQNFVGEPSYVPYWAGPETMPPFMRKEGRPLDDHNLIPGDEYAQMDAAKRKQLPPWIREGLEKMERDRQRQQEKERMKQAYEEKRASQIEALAAQNNVDGNRDETSLAQKSKFDSDSEDEDKVNMPSIAATVTGKMSPVKALTEEELMLKVRRMLTEILLEVTNEEILAVSREVHQRARFKAPAQQLATSSALASITGILGGLADYGSGVSDDDEEAGDNKNGSSYEDSDAELERIIEEKKRTFAEKEAQIVAMLEEAKNVKKEKDRATNFKEEGVLPSEELGKVASSPETKVDKTRLESPEKMDRVLPKIDSKQSSFSKSSSSSSSSESESETSGTSRSTDGKREKAEEKTASKKEDESKKSQESKSSSEDKSASTLETQKSKRSKSRSSSSSSGRRNRCSRSKSEDGRKSKRSVSKERKNRRKEKNRRSRSRNRWQSRDSRSHSRERTRRRHRSRDKRSRDKRSRSRDKRSRSRDKRSRSEDKRSRSQSRDRNTRSRSRDRKTRSRSRDKHSKSKERKTRKNRSVSKEPKSKSKHCNSPNNEARKRKRSSNSSSQDRSTKKSKDSNRSKKEKRKDKSKSQSPSKDDKKSRGQKSKRSSGSPVRSKRRRSRSSSYESTRSGKKSSGKNKHR